MSSGFLSTGSYELKVRQQPKYARVAIGKEKGTDRKPIDPPPIVQLNLSSRRDPNNNFLQNPYLILTARLISPKDDDSSPEDTSPSPNPKENALTGTVVSSLYSLKDTDNTQGGFFVFGDLSVRKEGHYRLEFTLYELKLADRECWMLSRVVSDKFQVFFAKGVSGYGRVDLPHPVVQRPRRAAAPPERLEEHHDAEEEQLDGSPHAR